MSAQGLGEAFTGLTTWALAPFKSKLAPYAKEALETSDTERPGGSPPE